MLPPEEQTRLRTRGTQGDDEQTITAAAVKSPTSGPAPTAFAKGDMIDHFVVTGTLGAGAMGVVLDAYDPDLERRVAIKVVRGGAAHDEARRGRMLREAQSMARVSHRNVVTVHEVGLTEGRVYIAMELIDGGSLKQWQKQRSRSLEAILEVFRAAGQGLAAAHRAGLVHRDFKPDNVLVSREGRVAVTDFGLVALRRDDPSEHEDLREPGGALHATLTDSGSMLGTPAYMAPEQHRREVVGPRADQFAFCVALWEALYGQRPFAGKTLVRLAGNVIDGRRDKPPARTTHGDRVPRRIRRALERGLSTRPGDRWPRMEPLLEALSLRRVDPRPWIALTAVVGLGGLAVWSVWPEVEDAAATCAAGQRDVDEVWNDQRRDLLRASFTATGRGYAEDTFGRVSGLLDTWSDRWSDARVAACEATHGQHQQSEIALDLRLVCLRRALGEAEALVTTLGGELDDTALSKAVTATQKLPDLSACNDLERLIAGREQHRGSSRAEVEALTRELHRGITRVRLGQGQPALAILAPVIEQARAQGETAILAEALRWGGELHTRLGSFAEAEAMLHEAVRIAVDAARPELEAESWTWLILVVGAHLTQAERAEGLIVAADVALRRIERPRLRARYHHSVANVRWTAGQLERAEQDAMRAIELASVSEADPVALGVFLQTAAGIIAERGRATEARTHYEHALELLEQQLGPLHPTVGATVSNLGQLIQQTGDLEGAKAHYLRSLAIWTDAYGPDHLHVAVAHENLGVIAQSQAELEPARAHYEHALGIRREALGDAHPQVASVHTNLGLLAMIGGDYSTSARHLLGARERLEAAYGPDHPALVDLELNLGVLRLQTEELDAARAHLDKALRGARRIIGPRSMSAVRALSNLAKVERQQGRCDQAVPRWTEAREILESELGLDSTDGAHVLSGLGWCALDREDFAGAEPWLTRAIAIRAPAQLEPDMLARDRYALGQVRWARGRESEGRALVEQARRDLEGLSRPVMREAMETWLAEHPRP